ncbi:hypothetical protein QYE76_061804 [Lolium multiflorum]|uniref:Aminotransferase-like plant mobile domain-containing protein n=1 Tax=Lolium multiflorum TaxID=4521 RepID=A0AAD8W7J6_LOLMU|nr:hypothetical protein QYE76_061804 [Lolium multiflorum]
MNPSALTALVDRWRPETHTFHLRAGEMAPTLQDVSMILGLPIQGEPLCMNTSSDGWRQQMEELIGRAPPPPADPKERAPAGASFSWIRTNFGQCPEGEILSQSIPPRAGVFLFVKIPDDEEILSQSIPPKHTSKQAPRSAYQFKPRGKAPNRYTPEDYVNRGKKVVTKEDEGPPRRSSLSRMTNDEPFSLEEEEQEEQEEQQEQQQQEPRQRTKRMAVRKQPARTARRGRH